MNEYSEPLHLMSKDKQINDNSKYNIRQRLQTMAQAERVTADEVKALIDDCAKGFFTSDITLTCLRSMHKLLVNQQQELSHAS